MIINDMYISLPDKCLNVWLVGREQSKNLVDFLPQNSLKMFSDLGPMHHSENICERTVVQGGLKVYGENW